MIVVPPHGEIPRPHMEGVLSPHICRKSRRIGQLIPAEISRDAPPAIRRTQRIVFETVDLPQFRPEIDLAVIAPQPRRPPAEGGQVLSAGRGPRQNRGH
ncbi:hypothetical protein D3C80_1768910 [compost metagenome]